MAANKVITGRRGLPADRANNPLTTRGQKLDSFVDLKGSGYDRPFPKQGVPADAGKVTGTRKGSGGNAGTVKVGKSR